MPPPDEEKKYGGLMLAIAWLLLLGLLYQYFEEQQASQFNPNSDPVSGAENGRKTLTLKANRQNHFVLTGQINHQNVVLLVDTGATFVAIPAHLAARLGLKRGEVSSSETANGRVQVYSTQIDTLKLGDIVLYNVQAHINPGMNGMNEVLLGMSALSQVEFTQRDGTLVISQQSSTQ